MSLLVPIGIMIFAVVIGLTSVSISKKDDGPVEEFAEEVIDRECERLFGGDCESIDLTPGSDELSDTARMKLKEDCETYCNREMDE